MSVPFAPRAGGTITLAANTSNAQAALPTGCHRLHIVNTSDGVAHVVTDESTDLAAAVTDFPVPPGAAAVMTIKAHHNRVAVKLASGATSASVYVTPGTGGSAV